MKNAVVSVVTPSYNAARFICAAIESVQAQTYQSWEIIVADDCSTDETCAIVEEMAMRDERIRLMQLPRNKGPAAARNVAIEAARGRYIAFLDSDDLWLPGKLEGQLGFMQEKDCALSYTAYKRLSEDGKTIGGIIEIPQNVDYESLLLTNVIGCLTAIYDTKVVGKVYAPDILKREDHALWLKILKMGHVACGLNESLALRRIRRNSDSTNKLEAAVCQWRLYRDVECLPFFKRLYCFANYAYHGYRKRIIK